jgi:hypothetical protein
MPMPSAAAVAQLIVADMKIHGTQSPAAVQHITSLVSHIRDMILAGTVNVTVATTDTGTAAVTTAPGAAPVTATGTGTGTGALT